MTDETEPTQTKTVTVDAIDLMLMDGGPYCLIRARADEDGELILKIRNGGGAEEEPDYLPLMALLARPGNHLVETIAKIRRELTEELSGDAIGGAMTALDRVAAELDMQGEEQGE